jgi:imidazolonepropionase-like amidohydrolase
VNLAHRIALGACWLATAFSTLAAAAPPTVTHELPRDLSKVTLAYVRTRSPVVVLTHVRVIDGTGAAALEDRNLTIRDGRIVAIDPGANVPAAPGMDVIELRGRSVLPGLVGMHDHLYTIARPNLTTEWNSEPPLVLPQMSFSAPRLYLAAGVTTLRTTGSVEPYADLELRKLIDRGDVPGPRMDVTGPYLEGAESYFMQMDHLRDAADARETVRYWADRGVTSFKAYMNITRDELKAVIEAAHARGIKVTGHLCSVSYPEAAELGIDDLEHGFFVNTQLDRDKQPDRCSTSQGDETLLAMAADSDAARKLIALLVARHVAVTSTLPVFENFQGSAHPPRRQAALDAMTVEAREAYLLRRERPAGRKPPEIDGATLWAAELRLERAFVAAGGLLLAGSDPTGDGGVVPGFADQREVELLVEAGFTPLEAIRIATFNGATYLGEAARIGSIAPGKIADLVVVKGEVDRHVQDIENVEIVFKDGIGYDPGKLLESVRGRYGQY